MATSVLTSYFPITDGGEILVGAKVFVLDVGTTNLKTIYSDQGLSVSIDNPMDTDADGFHPQAYLSGAYKLRIETGGTDTLGTGTLVRQWDNIDGGVPVGSGDLAVADGGTGASTAAGARTNLSVPSQTEVDDLSAELAELAGTVGSTGATQIATGTTAQRPADLSEGQFRRNTTTTEWEGYNGSTWQNFLTETDIASQATQETGTSTTTLVAPGRQHYHNSAAKAWGVISVSGGTPNLDASYGVTSITDSGVGIIDVNLSVTMGSANYVVVVGIAVASAIVYINSRTTTALQLRTTNLAAAAIDITGTVHFAVFGDLA